MPTSILLKWFVAAAFLLGHLHNASGASSSNIEHFERKIRPVLIEHCYDCHSGTSRNLKGDLRLDQGISGSTKGKSGRPLIVSGKPESSLLMMALNHLEGTEPMPPKGPQLSTGILADFEMWIRGGAIDPRNQGIESSPSAGKWLEIYENRLKWWSLKPIRRPDLPKVKSAGWARNPIDFFILEKLERNGLSPAPRASASRLTRRISLLLTGLPPSESDLQDASGAEPEFGFDRLVSAKLASPHFGERWARHWMDVLHYTDTHGYEWDAPAKNAWMFRDYLIRSFNEDLSYDRLIREQIAGDMIDPRVDRRTGLNECLIAMMAFRLGERRHGDNAAAEGVTQEAVANMIDTLTKGVLATTVACAQCHDHKLDAISQRDYYSLAGLYMNTRWSPRTVNAWNPNLQTLSRLSAIKREVRKEMALEWEKSLSGFADKIRKLKPDKQSATNFPETITALWNRFYSHDNELSLLRIEHLKRKSENEAHLKVLADFSTPGQESGWRWHGFGMEQGFAKDGDFIIAEQGASAIDQIVPAGRWSHLWSKRLAGSIQSPLFESIEARPVAFSIKLSAGNHAAKAFIIDHAFHSERMAFLQHPWPAWHNFKAGDFDSLEGGIDRLHRRVYLEIATKQLNNYFPPRTGYGGLKEQEIADERSWFGVTKVVEHPAGKPPLDDLERFLPLATLKGSLEVRLAGLLESSIQRWRDDECNPGDVDLLNDSLQSGLLPNQMESNPSLSRLIQNYRSIERSIVTDSTIGSAEDWLESKDERTALRGSYKELGEPVPRGRLAFLKTTPIPPGSKASGRLEFAQSLTVSENPLTARVFVNRVWQHLFGQGLVRTPDDFGHLGEQPSHPELLDYLADRFITEGWSLKNLVSLIVSSSTWQQDGNVQERANEMDPENRLLHHFPMLRLDAETIRDSMLAVSGRLDERIGGTPVDPPRASEDRAKRLFSGPLDGLGRRSIYAKVTLMEPPRFMALFNQPIPKVTVGKRDVTDVPDQALAMMNDPLVLKLAGDWSRRVMEDGATTTEERASRMIEQAFGRKPRAGEATRLTRFATESAGLRSNGNGDSMRNSAVWQDVAHAIFNLKEFTHVQ